MEDDPAVLIEKALLGAVMIGGAPTFSELRGVREEHFASEPHRLIWRALSAIAGRGEAPDLLLTVCELEQMGDRTLSAAGGAAYLSSLLDLVPDVENASNYAFRLRTFATARRFKIATR
jgi:replicative DNA helicase